MLERYKHVVWDWNGTLLDDLDLSIEVMNGILGRRELPLLDRESYHRVFDFPVRDYYGKLGLDVSDASFRQLSVEFISAYDARRLECMLHAGAAELLAAIEQAGLTQSILSAYRQETLVEIVTHFGLQPHFVRMIGLDNIYAHSKAELGRAWTAELGLPPQEVLLIGDTLHDREVARAMGVDCVLVAAGHHPAGRLRVAGNQVVGDLAALREMLLG